jgi:hypothetical protein
MMCVGGDANSTDEGGNSRAMAMARGLPLDS